MIKHIKELCRYVAEQEDVRTIYYLSYYVEYMEELYTEKYTNGCSNVYEMEFCNYNNGNTEEMKLWMRIRDSFFHYILGKRKGEDIYEYPYILGMSKSEAKRLATELKQSLSEEGLCVEFNLCKEYMKMKNEQDGEQMYSFYLNISWE